MITAHREPDRSKGDGTLGLITPVQHESAYYEALNREPLTRIAPVEYLGHDGRRRGKAGVAA